MEGRFTQESAVVQVFVRRNRSGEERCSKRCPFLMEESDFCALFKKKLTLGYVACDECGKARRWVRELQEKAEHATSNANAWCREYNEQKKRADNLETELNILRAAENHYDTTIEPKLPEETLHALKKESEQVKFDEALKELEDQLREVKGLPRGGVIPVQTQVLLMFLVKRGVI